MIREETPSSYHLDRPTREQQPQNFLHFNDGSKTERLHKDGDYPRLTESDNEANHRPRCHERRRGRSSKSRR